MEDINVIWTKKLIFLLAVILVFILFSITSIKATAPGPPEFDINPADNPDPVDVGNSVTFTATATDPKGDAWYLAICMTNAMTNGAPPTCDGGAYCISTSTSSGAEASCSWTSTGSGAQNWFGFPADGLGADQGTMNNANSPITVNVPPTDNAPTATLTSPIDNFNTTSSSVTFTGTASDDINLANITLYGDWGGGWQANETNSTPLNNTATSFTESIIDGTYVWNYYACDNASQCAFATSNRTFTIDTQAPKWQFPSVNDSTPLPNRAVRHNINWTDNIALNFATLEINSTGASCDTTSNVSSTTLSGASSWANLTWLVPNGCEGKTIGWRQYSNDSLGQWNVTDLQTYDVQNIAPTASFGTNPIDNYNSSSSSVTFDLKVSDNLDVDALRLYGNWSGAWAINQTNMTAVNDSYWNITVTGIPEGYYVWAAWGNDTVGNEDFTNTNRTFTVDLTVPSVSINSPLNQNYTVTSILFNVTSTDNFNVNSCQYSLNGAANVSLTNSAANYWTDTNASMTQGSHTVDYYCDDFVGNLNGTESVTFSIDSIAPQILFTTGTEANASSKNQQFVFANVTLVETNFANITFKLYNSTGLLNTNFFTDSTREINWTGLLNDNVLYWYNVSTYDQYSNFNETETRYITLTADNPPTWSNPSVNDSTPTPPTTVRHNILWADGDALSYATLEINSTGASCNTAANVSSTTLSGASSWANLTWLVPNGCEGKTIGWRQYSNDSLGQWNVTDLQTYDVQNIAPTASFGTNPIDNYNSSSSSVTFELSVSDNLGVDYLILYGDWNGTWRANQTNSTPINSTTWSVTVTGIPEGQNYKWAAWGNDTVGNSVFTSTNRTFTVDLTVPNVSINSPLNQSYTTNSITFNVTSTDNFNVNSCQYSLNDATNVSLTNSAANYWTDTNASMTQGSHTVDYYCDDFVGNLNSTESVTFFIDSIIPQIVFVAPTEANASSKNQQFIFANVSLVEDNFANITFKLYNSTGLLNTNFFTDSTREINWTGLLNDNTQYQYNVSTYDEIGNFNETETRYITLTADNPPTVTIDYPQAIIYNVDVTQLNYTASDSEGLSACWYSTNGGASNTTITCGNNVTGLTSTEGSNTWTVYANDSIGQEASDSVTFTKDTVFPTFSGHVINPSPPNEDQDVQVNVTITESNKDIVILEWNGTTNYTVSTNVSNEYYYTITSGNYTAHDSVNYSWYANDTAGNLNKSSLQSFTVANQIPTVSAPALDDTTPLTNDIISCDGGTFSDNDAEDTTETGRAFLWYNNDAEIPFQSSQTLNLLLASVDKSDVVKCSTRVSDGFNFSAWVNSSNTATVQNSPPTITNPLTSISWDANGSTFNYDYDATDDDSDSITWYDNATLFDINGTGYISDIPTESEAGVYEIRISSSDGTVNATDDFTYTINDVTLPNIGFASPTEANDSQLTRNYIQVNVTASDGKALDTITLFLYNSTSLVQTNTSATSPLFVNFTGLPDEFYYFNSTVNDSSGNENSTETRTVSTDTGAPAINYVSPTEASGVNKSKNYVLVNVTASDPNLDKIIIRLYDSSNNSINSATTSTSPNYINFSGLSDGIYYYNATANDTFSNEADLSTRKITLDTTIPSVTNLVESPSDPATWASGTTYEFNATITDDNLDTVLIEFDGVNYTPTQTGNVYNLTRIDLAAGTYNYYWWANDSAGNVNLTSDNYNINNATGNITLLINDSASNQVAPYGTQTNASASTLYGSVTLYRNGTDVTSENNAFVTLATDYYNYTAVSNGDENHSSASTTLFVDISKSSSEVNLTLNVTDGNVTIVQDSAIYLNATTISGDSGATLKLYNAGTLINQGTSPLSNLTTFNTVGVFNITGFYEASQNFTSSFETWWVNVTETPDITNPNVSSLTESPSGPATYFPGQTYEFNATITDNRVIDTVIFEFDGTNYTSTNLTGNIYNFTTTGLSAGAYNYRWYANDTSGNMNSTESGSYTINQETTSLNLTITPSNSETYGTETTATGNNCPSQLICNLYRDGVSVSNPDTSTLNVGTYNYTYNTTGNTNYTANTNTTNLIISQETGSVFTYVNNLRANKTIEQYTEIYLNGTLETGSGTINLYNNGTLINQGTSPLSNLTNFTVIGEYNITTFYDGNENYTSASETWWVNVTEADVTSPNIVLDYPANTTYNTAVTQLNYTASDNIGLDTCWYSINNGATNTTITCGNNVTGLSSGEGSSTWKVYANDSKGNENSSSVVFFVDSINPTISYASPTETSGDSLGRNYVQVNVTASDTNLDTITIFLYNSTSLVQTNTLPTSPLFVNFTSLTAETYFFNATVNDTASNEVSTSTRNVSLVAPTLSIILPKNETYIGNESLKLNYTTSLEDFVWYNIDSGSNTTITENTTFNTSSGGHTLNLYANNSNGETTQNITFTVNASKFRVEYNNYKGSQEGSSTEFNISSYEDLQNISNVVLENTDYGKIEFNEAINITNDSDLTDNQIDLDNYTNISQNHIEINSTALPNLNKSATLYLYNLSFSNPRVLRNDVVCSSPICTEVSYSSGTFVFNVTQFTNYSAEETPTEGDGSPTGGGGGDIGGGVECTNNNQCEGSEICWNNQCSILFDIKIIDFASPAKLGEFFEFTYLVKGVAEINGDVEIDFWIEKEGEIVTSGKDVIYLGSFEEKTESTKIFLPSSFKSGIYKFHVKVSHPSYSAESFRTIEVQIKGGTAIIGSFELGNIQKYLVIGLVILAVLILSIIFYTERRKFIREFFQETRWLIKHRKTILTAILFVFLSLIIYLLNLIKIVSEAVLKFNLWFKTNVIPYIGYVLILGIMIILIVLLFKNLKEKKFFEKLKERRSKKKLLKKLKKKYKKEPSHRRESIKKLTIKISRVLKSVFHTIGKGFKFIGKGLKNLFKNIYRTERNVFREAKFELKTESKLLDQKITGIEKKLGGFEPPKLDINKQFSELKKSGTKFRLPGLEVPRINLSKLKLPETETQRIKLPRINLTRFFRELMFKEERREIERGGKVLAKEINKEVKELTKTKFELPSLEVPRIKLPKIHLSKAFSFKKEEKVVSKEIGKEFGELKKVKLNLPGLEVPRIKLPKFKIPGLNVPKIKLPHLNLKKEERAIGGEVDELRKIKLSLPEANVPKIKLPRFRLPHFSFKREKTLIKKGEIKISKSAGEVSKFAEEMHDEVSRALTVAFGKKTWKSLTHEFEKTFAKKKVKKKKHSEFLKELGRLKSKIKRGEHIAEEKVLGLRKNANSLINELSVYVKKMHLSPEFPELKRSIKIKKSILNIGEKMKGMDKEVLRFFSPKKRKSEDALDKFFQRAKKQEITEQTKEQVEPSNNQISQGQIKQEEPKEKDIIEHMAEREKAEKERKRRFNSY